MARKVIWFVRRCRQPRIVLWGGRVRDWAAGHEPGILLASSADFPRGPQWLWVGDSYTYVYVR